MTSQRGEEEEEEEKDEEEKCESQAQHFLFSIW